MFCTYYWKRSTSLKVEPLSLPRTVIWNIAESMFDFHQLDYLKSSISPDGPGLRPRALPPQRATVPSGGMLNQHVDFSLTCIWPPRTILEVLPDISIFFSRKCAGIKGLFSFFFWQSVTLWPPCWALLLTDLWSCWGFLIRLGRPVKHCPHSLTQTSAPVPFSTCQRSHSGELWNLCLILLQSDWLIHTWKCKGPTFPKKDGAYSR